MHVETNRICLIRQFCYGRPGLPKSCDYLTTATCFSTQALFLPAHMRFTIACRCGLPPKNQNWVFLPTCLPASPTACLTACLPD